MTSLRTITTAAAATCLLAAVPAVAVAASSPPAPSSSTSPPPSTSAPTTSSTPSTTQSRVDNPIRLRLDSKGRIDEAALPDEGTVFSERELSRVIPGLTGLEHSEDTLTLTIKGEETGERSTLVLNLKRFGKSADVTKAWAKEKRAHQQRSARYPGIYTFFQPGQHGVADSFTDGTTTHVLVKSGSAAGEIWFSGIGFTTLGTTHAAARSRYVSTVVPQLVELLGDKVKAGAPASQPASKSPTANASPTAAR